MTSSRLTQLLTFLAESPDDSFLLFAIAKEHEKLGAKEIALEYYLKLKAIDVEYIGTYFHLGKLYEDQGKAELALTTYQAGIEIAKKIKDQHALSELMGAKMNLELEM